MLLILGPKHFTVNVPEDLQAKIVRLNALKDFMERIAKRVCQIDHNTERFSCPFILEHIFHSKHPNFAMTTQMLGPGMAYALTKNEFER